MGSKELVDVGDESHHFEKVTNYEFNSMMNEEFENENSPERIGLMANQDGISAMFSARKMSHTVGREV